jgi:recombination protein RecA
MHLPFDHPAQHPAQRSARDAALPCPVESGSAPLRAGGDPTPLSAGAAPAEGWTWSALRGRLGELWTGPGGAALSQLVDWAWQAQRAGEPVAWVHGHTADLYAEDLWENGVDLGALAVVRLADARAVLQAAERLVRSGGFGLVVLDVPQLEPWTGVESGRLARLAAAHGVAVVVLQSGRRLQTPPPMVSWRAQVRRQRLAEGGFARVVEVQRDRRGPVGTGPVVRVEGPVGCGVVRRAGHADR